LKKHTIIALLAIIIFMALYFYTDSWKWTFLILSVILLYIAFEIVMHRLGPKKDTEKQFKTVKKDHIKRTEGNPTLR
jgi:uncharacterized membrane protein